MLCTGVEVCVCVLCSGGGQLNERLCCCRVHKNRRQVTKG